MNLRTGLAALAVAATGLSAKAQTNANHIIRNEVVVKVVKKPVQKDSLTLSAKAFENAAKKTNKTAVKFGFNFLNAEHLSRSAGELNSTITKFFKKGNMEVKANTYFGKNGDASKGGMKLGVGYNHNLSKDFSAGPRVNLHADLEKINNDSKGYFSPEIQVGGKYNHEFKSGVRVGSEANVGIAGRLKYDDKHTSVGSMATTVNAEASVGYKDVDLVVSGGKDVIQGNNIKTGLRFTF